MSQQKKPLDPILEEQIERSMRPYIGVLPPAGLKSMRDALEYALTTHPVAQKALTEIKEREKANSDTVPQDQSGVVPSDKSGTVLTENSDALSSDKSGTVPRNGKSEGEAGGEGNVS